MYLNLRVGHYRDLLKQFSYGCLQDPSPPDVTRTESQTLGLLVDAEAVGIPKLVAGSILGPPPPLFEEIRIDFEIDAGPNEF